MHYFLKLTLFNDNYVYFFVMYYYYGMKNRQSAGYNRHKHAFPFVQMFVKGRLCLKDAKKAELAYQHPTSYNHVAHTLKEKI